MVKLGVRLLKYSYRFAEQIFNSKLELKNELENIVDSACRDLSVLTRPNFNKLLENEFISRHWKSQSPIFPDDIHAYAKLDFFKDRIGVEVQFGHSSFIGIDLLKFQIASYSNLDNIDFGVYICTTKKMQKYLTKKYGHKWDGSLTFEKVINYLPHVKSAIQVPIYVIGIDI